MGLLAYEKAKRIGYDYYVGIERSCATDFPPPLFYLVVIKPGAEKILPFMYNSNQNENNPTEYSAASAAQETETVQFLLTHGRKGEPSEPPAAPRKGSTTAQIEEIFHESFLRYFKNAEEKRRWNIERDIPWEKATNVASDLTAQIVESFSAVEMYLPDYTHKIMTLIRRSRGRAYFQAKLGLRGIQAQFWCWKSG